MREYGKITPSFWIGSTGRLLRGDPEAQIVAVYLLTAPGSTMMGIFYCPIATIANDTGLSPEGASEALRRVCDASFCTFDEATEWVWVHEMARYQIEPSLALRDKRVIGICREFTKLPESPLKQGFHARYRQAFHLPKWHFEASKSASPFEGPSEPHRSQEQEQEQQDSSQGEDLSGLGAVGRADRLAVVASGAGRSAGRAAR